MYVYTSSRLPSSATVLSSLRPLSRMSANPSKSVGSTKFRINDQPNDQFETINSSAFQQEQSNKRFNLWIGWNSRQHWKRCARLSLENLGLPNRCRRRLAWQSTVKVSNQFLRWVWPPPPPSTPQVHWVSIPFSSLPSSLYWLLIKQKHLIIRIWMFAQLWYHWATKFQIYFFFFFWVAEFDKFQTTDSKASE